MKTVIHLSNGDIHAIDGHPDEFIEKFTADDYSTINKDLVMISPDPEKRPITINTRHIVKIEYKEKPDIEFLK
ncbi:hypothetical protein [Clostridium sp. Cult1]|uniref:hypothetical protein n=1 Tax=Clostridium sp. Cult1 TaxID=2079002 RepID=UPI001F178FD6|nr:hypothetical protein [Clostridium sp. Cult1]MCF6464189.1 hypothetical protein [Clostridium sp. Cult1]